MSAAELITSVKNPIVGRFRDAAAGQDPGLMVADGVKLVEEALAAGLEIVEVAASPRLVGNERGRALRRQLMSVGRPCTDCADPVLERVSSLTTHQGVAALLRRPRVTLAQVLAAPALAVVAAGVKDPGNLGALIRTAEAAGASGLLALAGGADPFRDKAVRGSAGSVFRLPVVGAMPLDAATSALAAAGVQVVVADTAGDLDYLAVDWRRPTAVVVGSEGQGPPVALARAATLRVKIPMRSPVESLNVAVAVGVLLYEARRQRA